MTGALSGVGQQQFPLSQGFQPGGTEQARQQKAEPAAKVQTENTANAKEKLAEPLSFRAPENTQTPSNDSENTSARRGSTVNIIV